MIIDTNDELTKELKNEKRTKEDKKILDKIKSINEIHKNKTNNMSISPIKDKKLKEPKASKLDEIYSYLKDPKFISKSKSKENKILVLKKTNF